jgi:sulfopropanediol 3-dehydrogenase
VHTISLASPVMQITSDEARALGAFTWLKRPAIDGPPAQRDPKVVERVSEMLRNIERDGLDAVCAYAKDLDGWSGTLEVSAAELKKSGDALPADVPTRNGLPPTCSARRSTGRIRPPL